jgi:hypothetical protein
MQRRSDTKSRKALTPFVPSNAPPKESLVTCDPDIRNVLMAELNRKFCDPIHDLILQEFGCKGARIDVAVVNGSLHGFEIKSDSDSLERLDKQVAQYSRIFDFITLVCGKRLFSSASKIIPEWWGLQLAQSKNEIVTLTKIRQSRRNPSQDKVALARMLWKDEALSCLRRNGYKGVTAKNSAEEVWNEAANRLGLRALAGEVRLAIKARGGSGFEKRSVPNGGSRTIESIVLANHSSQNLAWLLSQLSADPLR